MSEFGGLRKHEKTQHALYNELGLDSATLLRLAFLVEKRSEFPTGKFPLGQQKCTNTNTCMHFPTKNSPFGSVLNGPKIYGLLSIKKLRGDFGIRELYIDRLKTCLFFGVFLLIPVDLYRRVAGGW